MSHRTRTLLGLGTLIALAACSENPTQPGSITGPVSSSRGGASTGIAMSFAHARACPGAPFREASCHAIVTVDRAGKPIRHSTPSGYVPTDLLDAYDLMSASQHGAGQTIAVIDAYDDANAESDLAVYRAYFGLPSCTTANGCFRKVDQNGGTSYPRGDRGWSEEISLDLDMASAICPNCNLLLVEANSNFFSDLSAAVDEAADLGATVIANSYGGGEYAGEATDQEHYHHPGVAITASSGDEGYGAEFPAASQYVTAVGGTTLTGAHGQKSSNRGWTETAWSGSGSGCSAFIPKPAWQTDSDCGMRTVADVAAVADPNTGVAVYDTYRLGGQGGWLVFGGTSVANVIIAGVYALAGNASSITYGSSSYSSPPSSLYDITTGSNGNCGGSYLCTAVAGYDGPTGNGTPSGTGAF